MKFPPRELWTCYTDGSFCDNRSGAGVFSVTLKLEESFLSAHMYMYTTVFQAKVSAILACSDFCREARHQNETIHNLSDSKAALMALSSYKISLSCSAGTLFRGPLPQIECVCHGFQDTATLVV
jgi:hypothetical protein